MAQGLGGAWGQKTRGERGRAGGEEEETNIKRRVGKIGGALDKGEEGVRGEPFFPLSRGVSHFSPESCTKSGKVGKIVRK